MKENLIIFASGPDADVAYVACAAQLAGVNVDIIEQSDLLASDRLTVRFDGASIVSFVHTDRSTYCLSDPSVRVWNRRNGATLKNPGFETQREFEEASINARRALGCLKSGDASMINTWEAHERMSVKAVQMRRASAAGLRVPPTAITNNPDEVARLAIECGSICVKPFISMNFSIDETEPPQLFHATRLDGLLPLDEELVRASPLIYQKIIDKAFDARLVAFSDQIMGVQIPNDRGPAEIDYKQDFRYLSRLSRVSIPDTVLGGVRRYMRESGLGYAAFDFVVDHAGIWWFLEANTAGRMSWMDVYCDGVDIIQPFAAYLVDGPLDLFTAPELGELIEEAEERFPDYV